MAKLEGRLEKYGRGFVQGWVRDIETEAPVGITVVADGIVVASGLANEHRMDLTSRHKGDCAFSFLTEWDLTNAVSIEARVDGSDFVFSRDDCGDGSGIVKLVSSRTLYSGAVDTIGDGLVTGRLVSATKDQPEVELRWCHGEVIAITTVKHGKFQLPYSPNGMEYYTRFFGLADPEDGLEVWVAGTDIVLTPKPSPP